MPKRGPNSPFQLLCYSIGSGCPSRRGLPLREEHKAQGRGGHRPEDEQPGEQSHCHGQSQLLCWRARLHCMSIRAPWVCLHPWMCLGLGPGDTFSLHSSRGRHPSRSPGPQPWAGTAVKVLHSHPVGWMCPWLRVQSLRREEVAKGELCHQWERLGEKRGILRKVTMLQPQGAWLCDKRTPGAACSQSGVQWKPWPGAWEAQRSQRLLLPTCQPRSSTTTGDQAGPLP